MSLNVIRVIPSKATHSMQTSARRGHGDRVAVTHRGAELYIGERLTAELILKGNYAMPLHLTFETRYLA